MQGSIINSNFSLGPCQPPQNLYAHSQETDFHSSWCSSLQLILNQADKLGDDGRRPQQWWIPGTVLKEKTAVASIAPLESPIWMMMPPIFLSRSMMGNPMGPGKSIGRAVSQFNWDAEEKQRERKRMIWRDDQEEEGEQKGVQHGQVQSWK